MESRLKILVIRFSSFGDIVLTYPFLNELRRLYQGSQIDFITKPHYLELAEMHPAVDNYFEYSDFTRMLIKQMNYDIVFNLQGNPRSRRISSGIVKAYTVKKETLKKLLLVNLKLNRLRNSLPVFAKYLRTLHECNPDARLAYTVTKNLKSGNSDFITGEYALVSPSSKHFTKRLPADKFIELLKRLNLKIVITGDKNDTDMEICSYISSKINNSVNYCGKLSFTELASCIKKAMYVICNDSGVLHLAEALNKKAFVFFGSTVKEFGFYPQLSTTEIFDSGMLDCRPCSHIGKNRCIKGHFKCMNEIDIVKAGNSIKNFENEHIS